MKRQIKEQKGESDTESEFEEKDNLLLNISNPRARLNAIFSNKQDAFEIF